MGEARDYLRGLDPEALERYRLDHPKDWADLDRMARRETALEDYWYFLAQVVGNTALYPRAHKPLVDFMAAPSNKLKKLILYARGHMKSALTTIAFPAWRFAQDQNLRGFVCSHDIKDAQKFLKATANIILSPRYQELFPEVAPKMGYLKRPVDWSNKSFLLARESSLAEPSYQATSPRAVLTSNHFDFGHFDDIVTRESVRSKELIRETEEYHKYCEALLDPGAPETVVGTVYHHDDEYMRIRREQKDDYDIFVQDLFDEWGRPWWDTRYKNREITPDEARAGCVSIPALKRKIGSYIFNSQYRQDAASPETQYFREEQFELVDKLPAGDLARFRLCDLSGEQMTESFTAIVSGAVDHKQDIYVTDVYWGQYTPLENCRELIDGQKVDESVRPMRIGLERANAERTLLPFLLRAAEEEEVFIPYVWLDPKQAQKPKEERIMGLQPFVETGRVKILKTCRNREYLLEEATHFGAKGWSRLDILDALAQFPHVMFPGGQPQDSDEPSKPAPKDDVGLYFARLTMGYRDGRKGYIGADRVKADGQQEGVFAVPFGRRDG